MFSDTPEEGPSKRELLAQLRREIGAITPARVARARALDTSLEPLNELLGGWPHLTEISGAPGSGRLSLIAPTLKRLTAEGSRVAFVDPLNLFHPPGWPNLDLERVTLSRPPSTSWVWVTEQLLASGCFEAVISIDPPRLGREGMKLLRAAEKGDCSGIIISERGESRLPARARLRVHGWRGAGVECSIERGGRMKRVVVGMR